MNIKKINKFFFKKNLFFSQADIDDPELLRIENVTHEDEGWYTCFAVNTLGSTHESAYLHVLDEYPTIKIAAPHRGLPLWIVIIVCLLIGSCILASSIVLLQVANQRKIKNINMEKLTTMIKVVTLKPNPNYTCSGVSGELVSSVIILQMLAFRKQY